MKPNGAWTLFLGCLIILAAVIGVMLGQKATPSPTPTSWICPNCVDTGVNSGWTYSAMTLPRMVIHYKGDIVLEINADGKNLTVHSDGKITGDMPHDKAADQFWEDIVKAFPSACKEYSK